jgi:hypothetical protein
MRGSSAALLTRLLGDLMISTKVLGATASPSAIRLLDGLDVPQTALTQDANRAAAGATSRFSELLRDHPHWDQAVIDYPHRSFVTIRCTGRDEAAVHGTMAGIGRIASKAFLPIQRAASVGFNFTGMSVFTGPDPGTGEPRTFLRVAVGGHDEEMLRQVVDCFAEAFGRR